MGKSEGTICFNKDKFESEEKFAKAIWQTINNLLQAGYECLIKNDDVRNYFIEYCYGAGAFDRVRIDKDTKEACPRGIRKSAFQCLRIYVQRHCC